MNGKELARDLASGRRPSDHGAAGARYTPDGNRKLSIRRLIDHHQAAIDRLRDELAKEPQPLTLTEWEGESVHELLPNHPHIAGTLEEHGLRTVRDVLHCKRERLICIPQVGEIAVKTILARLKQIGFGVPDIRKPI